MIDKIIKQINDNFLLQGKRRITVALSGGADSVALLHVMISLSETFKTEVAAAHFNHLIRGDEAFRDEEFVKKLCADLGVKLICGSADVPAFAKENKTSLELAARKLRYEFFESLDTDAVATAHTASDNLETIIFNLTRGSGAAGLCGIPAKRGIYIRPLLLCTRSDIEAYCSQNNLQYVTDSTNLIDDCTRNIIRHNVVPVLTGINPSAETAAARAAHLLSDDFEFINNIAEKSFNERFCGNMLNIKDFSALPVALARRIIIKFYSAVTGESPDFLHIDNIYKICISPGKTSVPNNMVAVSSGEKLVFRKNSENPVPKQFSVKISKTSKIFFDKNKKIHSLFLKNALDCDRIVGELQVRTRMAGDKIRLKNRNATKTLKKLYTECSIPLEDRNTLPVISDDNGVIWIHGIGVAERCAVTESSRDVYIISVT